MKGLVARRNRILRARNVQHAQALAETARARDAQQALEGSAERLRQVRDELFVNAGVTSGASFSAYRELAGRLEQAGRQLDGAIYDARRTVGEKEGRQMATNREKEIAERLKDRAVQALEEQREMRLQAMPRAARMMMKGREG